MEMRRVLALFLLLIAVAAIGMVDGAKVQVGKQEYETLAAAIQENKGKNVEYQIYGRNVINSGKFDGAASSTFIGKDSSAEIVVPDGAYNKSYGGVGEITFKNLTFTTNDVDNKGFHHAVKETFENCTINGEYWTYGTSAVFIGCTFNQTTNDYCLRNYGTTNLTLTDCKFYTAHKSVLMYNEGTIKNMTANVNDCLFTYNDSIRTSDLEKAAIEMDASVNMKNITLIANNNKVDYRNPRGLYFDKQPSYNRTTVKVSNTSKYGGGVAVEENGGSAGIQSGTLEELIESDATDSKVVTVPVADVGNVTEVEIPASELSTVQENSMALELQMSKEEDSKGQEKETTVTLDSKVLATALSVVEPNKLDDAKIEISVKKVDVSELESKQIAAMEKAGKAAVAISAILTVDGKKISNFNGGRVDIKIPFELAPGMKANNMKLIYVSDDGKTEIIGNARFENGYIYASLSHFSDFVVVETFDVDTGALPQTGDNSQLFLWAGLLMLSMCAFIAGRKVRA